LSDSMTVGDALGLGVGMDISDTQTLQDSLGAGFGLNFSDTINFLQDQVQEFMVGGLTLALSDTAATFWADNLAFLFVGGVGPARIYNIGTSFTVLLSRTSTQAGIGLYRADTVNSMLVEKVFTQQ
jgi:hypothetical protein